jgi:hypothetical protein
MRKTRSQKKAHPSPKRPEQEEEEEEEPLATQHLEPNPYRTPSQEFAHDDVQEDVDDDDDDEPLQTQLSSPAASRHSFQGGGSSQALKSMGGQSVTKPQTSLRKGHVGIHSPESMQEDHGQKMAAVRTPMERAEARVEEEKKEEEDDQGISIASRARWEMEMQLAGMKHAQKLITQIIDYEQDLLLESRDKRMMYGTALNVSGQMCYSFLCTYKLYTKFRLNANCNTS